MGPLWGGRLEIRYINGPSGLSQAVNLLGGMYIQYSLPTTLEAAGTIELWVYLH